MKILGGLGVSVLQCDLDNTKNSIMALDNIFNM